MDMAVLTDRLDSRGSYTKPALVGTGDPPVRMSGVSDTDRVATLTPMFNSTISASQGMEVKAKGIASGPRRQA